MLKNLQAIQKSSISTIFHFIHIRNVPRYTRKKKKELCCNHRNYTHILYVCVISLVETQHFSFFFFLRCFAAKDKCRHFQENKNKTFIYFFTFTIIIYYYILLLLLLLSLHSLLYFLYWSEWAAPTNVHLTTCGPPGKKFGHPRSKPNIML